MHPIGFQFKRAHLCTVALGRRIFQGTKKATDADFDGVLDMTPARFDILYLIHGDGPRPRETYSALAMAELRRRLGLSRATISVAIGRLVELGLVTKKGAAGRGGKYLYLTKEGLRRIRLAFHLIFRKGKVAHRFGKFFALGAPKEKWRSWIDEEMDHAWSLLRELAVHLGNTSEVIYLFRRGIRWNEVV
jgi:DNA-binding MarR family transcriptional regulator